MVVRILPGECWWGGSAESGFMLPITETSETKISLYESEGGSGQYAPLFLSSKGRFVWSDRGYEVTAKGGGIEFAGKGKFELSDGYESLKGAYLAAMKEHFPFTGETPDLYFFRKPQYNTWMALETEQTTENILNYAENIINHGFPAGVLMIDGGWQEDYGIFEFNRRKVPDPKFLVDKLHEMGFKVMLWTSPIVSSAGRRFKDVRKMGYLCLEADGSPGVREWWSGYSSFLDLTNPGAVAWFQGKLDALMDMYGVDGYKFDAGDCPFYRDDGITHLPVDAREQTRYYNLAGEKYRFNEYRAAWNFGGRPIVARLHDKQHSWTGHGINTLIPNTVVQGLLGYAYGCPDMVGGGSISLVEDNGQVDEELIVRWAQANAMMPMMQLSLAPWDILSDDNYKIFKAAVDLHSQNGELFAAEAVKSSKSGEPIMRCMEYEFPNEGFEMVNDQFMIGDKIMVAPVITKGCFKRKVKFPSGCEWVSERGETYQGGTVAKIDVPIERIPVFTRK